MPVVFAAIAILVLGVLIINWQFKKARRLIDEWTARNGYRILNRRFQLFWRGPFWWRSSKGQMVYRVTVQDRDGNTRKAWIRCGGFFAGLLSDQVSVEWDD